MSWNSVQLADLCTTFTDGDWIESKDQSEHGVRLIQTGNIGAGYFKDRADKARFIAEDTFDRLKCTGVFAGDCLVSRLPHPIGRSCLIPSLDQPMITAVDCSILRFDQTRIRPEYFVYYSQSATYDREVGARTSGTTRARISRSNLGKVRIPLPPLTEQERIIVVLDKAFDEIATASDLVERNIRNARSAFHTELAKKFQELSATWPMRKISDLASKVGSGATPRGGRESYQDEGVLLVRSLNVHDRYFKTDGLVFLSDEQAERLSSVEIAPGDVLLNITGASVARCCIAPSESVGGRVNQHVAIIRPIDDVLSSTYLAYTLSSEHFKKRLLGIGEGAGSTRQALTKADILQFEVPVPPLAIQKSLCCRLDEFEREADALRASHTRKKLLLAELKQSLLARAFSGNLTREPLAA